MADRRQLALLKRGVSAWNRWRAHHPDEVINLQEADLQRANLYNARLEGADLQRANLVEARLVEARLEGARLEGARLEGAYLREADLQRANLYKARLEGAHLREADLEEAHLHNARLEGAHLQQANLAEANLAEAKLTEARLEGAHLEGARLEGAHLQRANLYKARLEGANLKEAHLQRANLVEARLVEVRFEGADLEGADLEGADLEGAHLEGAHLQRTDLRGANLKEANLRGVHLYGANLKGANLKGADLRGARLEGAHLVEAQLQYANLQGADLEEAKLQRTNLQRANLQRANLQRANLTASQVLGTNFTGANLSGACIADWHIGSSTRLERVQCDHIFRTSEFSSRLPVDPESTFAPGEFEQRFQMIASALETIDITFTDGIDWQAFFESFQAVHQQYAEQNIAVQGMQKRGEAFVVSLEVDTDETGEALEKLKGEIETTQKQLYGQQLAAIEAQYERQLRLQGAHLEDIRESLKLERQERGRLSKVIETMADQQKAPNIQINHSNIGSVVDAAQSGSRVQSIQHIYAPEQQDLSAAAQEIQTLLNTLAETYNTSTNAGQEKLIKEASAEVQKHPKWRRALKEGGIELIKLLCAPIGIPLEMARVYLEE